MNVSIVIPVYNEADQLAACLQAIARQTVTPLEVIVVDNNSTDSTAAITQQYPFVRLLSEPRQGVVHARNRGFTAARGEIIGRIDADTLLPSTWVAQVQTILKDPAVSAVSGAPHYYDFALDKVADKLDFYFRGHLARKLGTENFLWGANMALRRTDWQQIKSELCSDAQLHEDFDLGIHLQTQGHKVIYDENLVAGVSARRIDTDFLAYIRYTLVSPRTYALHHLSSRRHMYPVLLACWLGYLPGRLIYRSYNPVTETYSLSQLLSVNNSRVDPSRHVA